MYPQGLRSALQRLSPAVVYATVLIASYPTICSEWWCVTCQVFVMPMQVQAAPGAVHSLQRSPQQLSSDCTSWLCCRNSCFLYLSVLLALSCCPQVSTAAAASAARSHGKHTPPSHQRYLKQQSIGTSRGGSLFAPPLLPVSNSSAYPFSAVGQLANGCSAFLISPCHIMTVAHCVVEPHRKIWYHGLEFYPGRWAEGSDSTCALARLHRCPCSGSTSMKLVQCTACAVIFGNQLQTSSSNVHAMLQTNT